MPAAGEDTGQRGDFRVIKCLVVVTSVLLGNSKHANYKLHVIFLALSTWYYPGILTPRGSQYGGAVTYSYSAALLVM